MQISIEKLVEYSNIPALWNVVNSEGQPYEEISSSLTDEFFEPLKDDIVWLTYEHDDTVQDGAIEPFIPNSVELHKFAIVEAVGNTESKNYGQFELDEGYTICVSYSTTGSPQAKTEYIEARPHVNVYSSTAVSEGSAQGSTSTYLKFDLTEGVDEWIDPAPYTQTLTVYNKNKSDAKGNLLAKKYEVTLNEYAKSKSYRVKLTIKRI